MTNQTPKSPESNPPQEQAASKRKAGSFSLFGDDAEWSVVTKRKGSKSASSSDSSSSSASPAATADANSTSSLLAKNKSKKTRASKDSKVTKQKKTAKTAVKAVEDGELFEGEIITPEVIGSSNNLQPSKLATHHQPIDYEDALVEDVQPEVVQPPHKLSKGNTLEAHIVDTGEVAGVIDADVQEVAEVKPNVVKASVPVLIESEQGKSKQLPVAAPNKGTQLAAPRKKRIIVPDPNKTDAELDIKELEVLRQIKEFNAKQLEADQEHEESLTDDYFERDDDDDATMSGMHLESHKSQRSKFDDDDYGLGEDYAAADLEDTDDDADEEEEHGEAGNSAKGSKKSRSRAVVRSAGNIAAFIRIANQEPLLTPEQERFLAERFLKYGDIEAARKLVTSHLRLVVSVAHGYTGYGLPLPDLIQEGNVGLMKAVKHFDPESGRLAAFAVHWIRSEINEYVIRNWRVVKVATTKAQRKIFFNLRQLKKHLGWFTENERQEFASNLGVSYTDVAEMELRLAGSDIGFDLDEDDSANDKTMSVTVSPSAYLEDENSDFAKNFESVDFASWQIKKLKESLRSLDERSQYIIKRHWLDDSKATLQELSNELGISIERVRQIENNAMNKVKIMLVNEGVNADGEIPPELPQLPNKTSAKSFPLAKREEDKITATRSNASAKRKTAKTSKAKTKVKETRAKEENPNKSASKSKRLVSKKLSPISKDHALVPISELPEPAPEAEPKIEISSSSKVGKHLSQGKIVDVPDA